MCKSERTKRMTTLLLNHFNNWFDDISYVKLKEEVMCNTGQCRCDLAGFEYRNNEAYASIGIEIKQSASDFHSGCGLNFVFDVNYLCVPSELVGYAMMYLEENDLYDVGIIEYRYTRYTRYTRCPTLCLIKLPKYNHSNSINRNNCLLNKSWFDNLYSIPDSVYSFRKARRP